MNNKICRIVVKVLSQEICNERTTERYIDKTVLLFCYNNHDSFVNKALNYYETIELNFHPDPDLLRICNKERIHYIKNLLPRLIKRIKSIGRRIIWE